MKAVQRETAKEMTAMKWFKSRRERSDARWFQMMRQAMLFRQIP